MSAVRVVLWFALLSSTLAACPVAPSRDAGATQKEPAGVCRRDSECSGDELCACATTDCSLCRSRDCYSHLADTCVSREVRLDVWIPVFVRDAGWVLERSDAGTVYESQAEALSAAYQLRR